MEVPHKYSKLMCVCDKKEMGRYILDMNAGPHTDTHNNNLCLKERSEVVIPDMMTNKR